ncbi:MAG TPA: hypothetical protein VFO34_07485 [Candidatus Acidoferrales bacterium]|nr:hypothetical protein [Candidatus Acidoferrales bacterium]
MGSSLEVIDTVIEILRIGADEVGLQLCIAPRGILWFTYGGFHVFFGLLSESQTVEIYSILDGPLNANRIELADVLCAQILLESMALADPCAVVASGN